MIKKSPKADLRSKHTLFVQLGIICSLLFMIAATHMNVESDAPNPTEISKLPDVEPVIILPIFPPETPPPPMRPSVFNPVPDDSPIEPDPIRFDPVEFDGPLTLPKPPNTPPEPGPYIPLPEIMPEIKGGLAKLYREIEYPKQAKQIGIEGRVVVQFIVNKNGDVENPKILRGIGGGCDEEVLRVIKLMKFTPGIQNGTFVPVKIAQTVTFKLQN